MGPINVVKYPQNGVHTHTSTDAATCAEIHVTVSTKWIDTYNEREIKDFNFDQVNYIDGESG